MALSLKDSKSATEGGPTSGGCLYLGNDDITLRSV